MENRKLNPKETVLDRLLALKDDSYQKFQSRLRPTIPSEAILGIRTPRLRSLAKELSETDEGEAFIRCLPHRYYEENNLHAFIIERIPDFDKAVKETERFLPYVDNWATCDSFSPKVFAKHKDELIPSIRKWLSSGQLYTMRFAIGRLMRYYLDGDFSEEYLGWVASIQSGEYYLNRRRAWYFATALAKQPEAAFPFFLEDHLDEWTWSKAIQKAKESFRVSLERKEKLSKLKKRS